MNKRMATDATQPNLGRSIQAGVLAWILPGAGHFALGHRGLAAVFFIGISLPYLTGVAIGGVKYSVNAKENIWLFAAEMGVGGYTTAFSLWGATLKGPRAEYESYFPESDVAQIYLAAAGLLNVLAVLDALSRAQTGGLPTYHRDLPPETDGSGKGGT
jgi:hypothetical protein